jgi:hypothetical protein
MLINWDLNLNLLVIGSGSTQALTGLSFRLDTIEPMQLRCSRAGVPAPLPTGAVLTFGIKAASEYQSAFLAVATGTDWTGPVSGDPFFTYTASLDLGGAALLALLSPDAAGSTATEQDSLTAMGSMSAQVPGETRPRSCQTVAVTIYNNVNKGNEGVPLAGPPPYPTSSAVILAVAEAGMAKFNLETIKSATGGGAPTDLSGVNDTNFLLYQAVEIFEGQTNAGAGNTTWNLENITDSFPGDSTNPPPTCPAYSNSLSIPSGRIWRKRAGLKIGTSAGTVAAGNDSRLANAVQQVSGLAAGTGADNTASFQAAHDALPATGGRLIIPPGQWYCTGTVNVTKAVIWQGSGFWADSVAASNGIFTSSATNNLFNVSSAGVVFEDLVLQSTAATPTAGALIYFSACDCMRLTRCLFGGGWMQVQTVNGQIWAITDCIFSGASKYALEVADVALPDGGDQSIIGCVFATAVAGANSAAVHYVSGGGLKMTNNKINGAYGAGAFTDGVLIDFTGGNSSIFLFSNNSVENVTDVGIKHQMGSGNFGKIIITGNEFLFCPAAAISIGNSVGGVYGAPVQNLEVGPNVITQCGAGVALDLVSSGHVAFQNTDSGVPVNVTYTGKTTNVVIDDQHRTNPGFTVQGASDASGNWNNPVSYRNRTVQGVSTYPAAQVMFRLAVPPYMAGVLTVTTTGIVPGHSGFLSYRQIAYYRNAAGAVALTTLTTRDDGVAPSDIALNFDTTTVTGEIQITHQLLVAAGTVVNYDVKAEGVLSSFKVGP